MKEKLNSFILSSFLVLSLIFVMNACTSYDKFQQITQELEMPTKTYKADFNQTWQALLQIAKGLDISQQSQEAGIIRTRWIDNTDEVNFANSFDKSDAIKAARYRLTINVVKGYRAGHESTKVTMYKRQMIEQDFLQGWKEVTSDGITEATLLYRLGQLIKIDNKLKEIDKAKEKEALERF